MASRERAALLGLVVLAVILGGCSLDQPARTSEHPPTRPSVLLPSTVSDYVEQTEQYHLVAPADVDHLEMDCDVTAQTRTANGFIAPVLCEGGIYYDDGTHADVAHHESVYFVNDTTTRRAHGFDGRTTGDDASNGTGIAVLSVYNLDTDAHGVAVRLTSARRNRTFEYSLNGTDSTTPGIVQGIPYENATTYRVTVTLENGWGDTFEWRPAESSERSPLGNGRVWVYVTPSGTVAVSR